jgi:hypothetical protein
VGGVSFEPGVLTMAWEDPWEDYDPRDPNCDPDCPECGGYGDVDFSLGLGLAPGRCTRCFPEPNITSRLERIPWEFVKEGQDA